MSLDYSSQNAAKIITATMIAMGRTSVTVTKDDLAQAQDWMLLPPQTSEDGVTFKIVPKVEGGKR